MIREQIKNQINQLNRNLNSYKVQKTQYETLKNNVTQIVNLLNNSIKSLNNTRSYLQKSYGGNIKTTPYKNTDNDIKRITEIKKYLELKVILEINSQIKKLNSECTSIQNKINNLWRVYYRVGN